MLAVDTRPAALGRITSIRLQSSGNQEWPSQQIEITSAYTTSEFTSPDGTTSTSRGLTSLYEWPLVCQLVNDSGLFAKQGETILVNGDHAGEVALTVTFLDEGQSTVVHRFFFAAAEPPFWTLVRVIEASALHALPISEPGGPR